MAHIALTMLLLGGLVLGKETPRQAFAKMQEAAQQPDDDAFGMFFASDAFHRMKEGSIQERRQALGQMLVRAKFVKVRGKDDEAVLVLKTADGFRELPVLRLDGQWRIARCRSYAVEKKELEKRQGRKAATSSLGRRESSESYGNSAYCFAYVTGDPKSCANRMDIWYCHNGDFHAGKEGRIADLGKIALNRVDGIPVGASWEQTLSVRKGHTYVIHCLDHRDRDFFVKFRVKGLKGGVVDIEWMLLAIGFGTPADIHKTQPLKTLDAADGAAGLCAKNG